MLKIMTWYWKQEKSRFVYTAEHVNRWAEQIEKYVSLPHTIACVTNLPTGINKNIEIIPMPKKFSNIRTATWGVGGKPQCYRRLSLFAPNAEEIFGAKRFVSMDLDVKIFNNIDKILSKKDDFIIMKSHNADLNAKRFRPYNGSMMMINAGARPRVYTEFNQAMAEISGKTFLGSDQAWIAYCLGYAEKTWDEKDGIYFPASAEVKKHGENIPGLRMIFYAGGAGKKQAIEKVVKEAKVPVNRLQTTAIGQPKKIEIQAKKENPKIDYTIRSYIYHPSGIVDANWEKLKAGFIASANANTSAKIVIKERVMRMGNRLGTKFAINHMKLLDWNNDSKVMTTPSVFMDTDMIILQDLAEIFENNDFDIAITVKKDRSWLNGGVVFANPTENARKIFELWANKDTELSQGYHRNSFRKATRAKTHLRGINQPSFALIYEEAKKIGKIIEVPCEIYNLCTPVWKSFSERTKVVHIKDSLRTNVLKNIVGGKYEYLIKHLREYYK